jgi:hypothetical protein
MRSSSHSGLSSNALKAAGRSVNWLLEDSIFSDDSSSSSSSFFVSVMEGLTPSQSADKMGVWVHFTGPPVDVKSRKVTPLEAMATPCAYASLLSKLPNGSHQHLSTSSDIAGDIYCMCRGEKERERDDKNRGNDELSESNEKAAHCYSSAQEPVWSSSHFVDGW